MGFDVLIVLFLHRFIPNYCIYFGTKIMILFQMLPCWLVFFRNLYRPVISPDLIGDLADCLVCPGKLVFHLVDDGKVNVFYRRFPGLLLHQVPEIIGREMELVSAPCD